MPRTLYVVRSPVPKRTSVPFAVSIPVPSVLDFKLSSRNHDDRSQLRYKVPDQMTKGRCWNTWIVSSSLIAIIAVVLFLEHHIRGLHSILSK